MAPHVAGAGRLEPVHVDPRPVDVVHEDLIVVPLGPGAAEIDHRPGMGVSAAGLI